MKIHGGRDADRCQSSGEGLNARGPLCWRVTGRCGAVPSSVMARPPHKSGGLSRRREQFAEIEPGDRCIFQWRASGAMRGSLPPLGRLPLVSGQLSLRRPTVRRARWSGVPRGAALRAYPCSQTKAPQSNAHGEGVVDSNARIPFHPPPILCRNCAVRLNAGTSGRHSPSLLEPPKHQRQLT